MAERREAAGERAGEVVTGILQHRYIEDLIMRQIAVGIDHGTSDLRLQASQDMLDQGLSAEFDQAFVGAVETAATTAG